MTMSWADTIRELMGGGGAGTAQAPAVPNPEQTFQQAAQQAPPQVVGSGLAEAFRSNQTPSFPEMVSTLFSHSNPDQRAGLLSRLMGAAGPAALSGPLAGLLGTSPGGQVSPQQASQVSPEAVQQVAQHAQNANPSIVDEIGNFYSQHPQVVTALGGLALSIAIQHMVRRS
jgi:hypothetical protein